MPLEEYRRKRDFSATPEPAGARAEPHDGLTFVVHKHAARALHYDVRLEIGGVYASWAVPKGPSLDPKDRRLAVHVEDHPLEYGDFEGVIPAGEYGGGTVMIWDRGTFTPLGDPAAMLAAGSMKFVLGGTKLTGAFALVRMKPKPGERGEMWLLIHERDGEAVARDERDVLDADRSAATGRTMDEIAASGVVWTAGGVEGAPPEPAAGPAAADGPAGTAGGDAVAGPLPIDAPFQLATLAERAPEEPGWLHQIKYDGYRVRLAIRDGAATVRTRNGADWTDRFPGVTAAAPSLGAVSALLDGEAVAFGADGRPDFGALQTALGARDAAAVTFVAFDLLYLDGFDLRGVPLRRRLELLDTLLRGAAPAIRGAERFGGEGPAFHASTCEVGLEGSVSKRADAPWVPGRSRDWVKVKCLARQEFVVGGWTDPTGSRSHFGALLIGVRDANGALRYAGRVGTGFTERTLTDLAGRLATLATDEAPFADPPPAAGVHWVAPELVVEVAFREWTKTGVVRQPSFRGLREDADPRAVRREDPVSGETAPAPEDTRATEPVVQERTESAPAASAPRRVAISNPDKVLEPAGLSKRQLADYYETVATAILPHVRGRLITAVRCPHGRGGGSACFYQKHPEARGWPSPLRPVTITEKGEDATYFTIDDADGLLALVQLGALEIHPWNSPAADPEVPDRFILDLDPGPGLRFADVVAAAHTLRAGLAALGLTAFPKTTGGAGLHLVVPVVGGRSHDAVRDLTHAFVERIAGAEPGRFTARAAKAARDGRVFVDYLRNAHGATAVAAFSTRARPGAPVSVPVTWDELDAGLDPASLDTVSVPARLAGLGADPWAGYEAARRPLDDALLAALGVEEAGRAGPTGRPRRR